MPEGGIEADESSRRSFFFEIFAISLAVIVLEITYTRIFSFKLFYYFTYLIIGVSLLGLGAGGVFVAVFERLRSMDPVRLVSRCCLVAALAIFGGYFAIARIQLNAFSLASEVGEVGKLLVIILFLFIPFLAGGIAISTILGSRPEQINRLYGVDLLGAALGCALCIPLIYFLTPPGAVMLSGFAMAVTGLRGSGRGIGFAAGVLAVLVTLGAIVARGSLPDVMPDETKTLGNFNAEKSPVVMSRWSPVFRVDVMKHPFLRDEAYIINHDGQMGSVLHHFDGNVDGLAELSADSRSFPFKTLKERPKVLIIGAAGGHEILTSLFFRAEHITGVELNPITYSLLTTHFADFSGRLPEREDVTLINGEGRAFLKQADQKFDLVWLVAPDSYAAMNAATSGAFVLSESYLYTAEMIRDAMDHLNPGGFLCAQFGELDYADRPNRTARYVSTARHVYEERGVKDFAKRVMVATAPDIPPFVLSTVLLKQEPFTPAERQRFGAAVKAVPGSLVRHGHGPGERNAVTNQVIHLPSDQLEQWMSKQPYDLSPVLDNAPFFWHFTRFRDALRPSAHSLEAEISIGERVLMVLLAFVVVLAAAFLLLPLVAIRRVWSEMPHKLAAGTYFMALGLGFMFFEVSLIQTLTLFLGYPTYSLSVTLFSVLVFTGLGSIASGGYRDRNRALWVLFAVLVVLAGLYRFLLPGLIEAFVGHSLALRVAIAVAVIAPLGLCLGGFMPLGLRSVAALSDYETQYVAWGWAVNGFFSVIASVLSTMLAMAFGFHMVMFTAVAVYLVGILALIRVPASVARAG